MQEPTDEDNEFLNHIDRMQEQEEAEFARHIDQQVEAHFNSKKPAQAPVNRLLCQFDDFSGFIAWLRKKGIRWE